MRAGESLNLNDRAAHCRTRFVVSYHQHEKRQPTEPQRPQEEYSLRRRGAFFNNRQRSASPSPSHSSKSRIGKFFNKFTTTSPSRSTLSFPLTSSTENPGGETPLGKYRISFYTLICNPIVDSSTAIASDGMPPNRPLLMMDSSRYPDHRTSTAPSESHARTCMTI